MKKINIFLISLAIVASSCSTYRYEEHQYRVTQPGVSGIITSTTADLNVSETRISHTENFSHNKYDNDVNVDKAKEYTMANALLKYNADVLVGPLYDVNTNDENDKVSVTVTGYPATYTNFRKTTPEDSILLLTTSSVQKVVTTKQSDVSTTTWNVKKGWQNSISAIFGVGGDMFAGLEYSGGWRFNKRFFAGFGTGYNFKIYDQEHYIPLYAQFKVFFWGEKRINPFIAVNQGIGAIVALDGDYYCFGSHTRGEIGVNFRFNPKTSMYLSYTIGTSPSIYDVYGYNYSGYVGSRMYHYLFNGLKLGFTF